MENSLGSFDPNVLPMDAFTLEGKASDASRVLGLKAPWIFGESSRSLTSDLALRANGSIKWTLGTAYKPNDVVYHDEDGLWYMNLEATDSIEPDYSDAGVEGVTWKWVGGSISGFVSGRGWWIKLADGTLIQRDQGATTFGTLGGASASGGYYFVGGFVLLPIDFYDTDYAMSSTSIIDSAGIKSSVASGKFTGATKSQFYREFWKVPSGDNSIYWSWIAVGRWKA